MTANRQPSEAYKVLLTLVGFYGRLLEVTSCSTMNTTVDVVFPLRRFTWCSYKLLTLGLLHQVVDKTQKKMKFSIATLALTQAAKNGKGGKHGGLDLSNDRFVWKVPKCVSNPDLCTESKTFTKGSGEIVLNEDNYNNYEVSRGLNRPFLKLLL